MSRSHLSGKSRFYKVGIVGGSRINLEPHKVQGSLY
jgi:hypothetical protein